MARILPLITALIVVVAAGFVHGRWTQRWEKSPELEAAVQRLDAIPKNVGNWKGSAGPEIDANELALAATDLEIGIRRAVGGVTATEPGIG